MKQSQDRLGHYTWGRWTYLWILGDFCDELQANLEAEPLFKDAFFVHELRGQREWCLMTQDGV